MGASSDQKISPPAIFEITDARVGLAGWLAIDSTINDHCCGGLRMAPDVSAFELRGLAEAMTLKYGFLGLPHGGAKAGIVCDENITRENRLSLLGTFGMKIRELLADRVYSPGPDMGTNNEDIRHMMKASGIRVPKRTLVGERSGWYTSLSVIASAEAAAVCQGINLSRSVAAIEGFGKVGSSVARGLHQLGCRVAAISTSQGALYLSGGLDIAKLLELSRIFGSKLVEHYDGAERIGKEQLLGLEVDVLFPCARHHSITMSNASRIKAKLISPGANIPITEEAEEFLFERGVCCVPDFIANSGGVLGGTMEFAGLDPSAIVGFVNHNFSGQVKLLFEKSLKENVGLRKMAEKIALARFARMKAASEKRSLKNKAFNFAVGLYRHGIIPRRCVGGLARGYFGRRIEGMI